MAINLLIDTCNLRRLVSKMEFSTSLLQLEFLVKEKHITLLAPETLKSEWEKQREEEKQIILKRLREFEKEVKNKMLLQDESAKFDQEIIDDAKRLLNSQVEMIDDLLLNYSTNISVKPDLLELVHKQRMGIKMPFRNSKKDNTNDALIIFAALNYLQDQKEKELYFLSDNTGEFALGSKPDCILHPDIAEVFPNIKAFYFTDIKDTYYAFDKLNIPRFKKASDRKFGKVQNVIIVDKTEPILNQVYEYLEKRFGSLIFIPKKLFAEHYPFITSEIFQYHEKPFALVTDNKEVFELLTQVKIDAGVVIHDNANFIKSDEDEKKIKTIFNRLSHNFINNVVYKNEDELPIIYNEIYNKCCCPVCRYERLDFVSLINDTYYLDIEDTSDGVQQKLRYAYVQYKIGNFIQAARMLQNLHKERIKNRDITFYIICFNLSHIAPFLHNYYWNDQSIQELGSELLNLDLEIIYKECRTNENKELLDWLHNKEFIKETFLELHKKVSSITDQFHGQNSGFNNNTKELIECYLTVDAFLNKNSIIYDAFSEFNSLTNLYTQGLLASYGCSPLLGGRLIYFTDLLLRKLMLSGKAEVIQKFLNRYKLKDITCDLTDKSDDSCVDIFQNLLNGYQRFSIDDGADNIRKYDYFWDNYSKLIYNSITLMAMISLDPPIVNSLAEKILTLLEEEKHLPHFQILKHIRFFLYRKQKVISPEILKKYFIAALKDISFHSDNYFTTLVCILNEKQIKISLSEIEFELIRNNFLDYSKSESTSTSWLSIGDIFSTITTESQKNEILKFVAMSLSSQFDAGKYYLATMYDMIPEVENYTDKYKIEIEKVVKAGQKRRPFADKEYYTDSRIDNFFNFCLKYKIDIPDKIKELLPSMGDYYNWLGDMDNFDYVAFNTDWLYNHFTIFFKKKFRNCNALKQHLLNLIKSDSNTEIERIFIQIYNYED